MIYSIRNSQNIQSKTKNKIKPPIFIKIKDKKIISNLLLMTKTIARLNLTIYLRISDNKLFIYSLRENEDKIRYVLILDSNNTEIEASNIDNISICLEECFVEILENFLLYEEFLQFEIDYQQQIFKLFTDSTIELMGFTHVQHKFHIFKSPEENYDFKIDIHNLEQFKGLGGGDLNSRRNFYFDKEKFRFIADEKSFNKFNYNQQFGLIVNSNSFNDLVKKLRIMNKKINQNIDLNNCCVCFCMTQNFLDYFSFAPNIVKKSKKMKKEKVGEVHNTMNNSDLASSHLAFGEKIYFKIKEIQVDRDNENNFINQGEIRMSAVRKNFGKNIEEFYFDSITTIDLAMSNEVFRENDDDFVNVKEKYFGKKNETLTSSFYIFGTSQNPLYLSKIENNNENDKINMNNSLHNNINISMLIKAKIEVDEDNKDGNLNNQNIQINNKRSIDNTVRILHHNNDNNSSSDAMRNLSRKKSMELVIKESFEDSINESFYNNNNPNKMIFNTKNILNAVSAGPVLNTNFNVNTNPNNQSSRGGYNINNNQFANNSSNPENIINKINSKANISSNKNIINPNIQLNSNYIQNPMNLHINPDVNTAQKSNNIVNNHMINQNQSKPLMQHANNLNQFQKFTHNIENLIQDNLNASYAQNNPKWDNMINSPFIANVSNVNPSCSLNQLNLISTNHTSMKTFFPINSKNQIDKMNLDSAKVKPFVENESKNQNPFLNDMSNNNALNRVYKLKKNDEYNPFLDKKEKTSNKILNANVIKNTNVNMNINPNIQNIKQNDKNIPNLLTIPNIPDLTRYIKKED